MKGKTKWGFFPFDAMDYKAAQAYLDKKSDAGWVLERLCFKYFARFIPAGGRYHGVDLNLRSPADWDEDEGFFQLCQDAGWEFVCAVRQMMLFRSVPGRRPAPLQTDEGMEADRFWKKYVRKQIWILLVVLLVLVPWVYLVFRLSRGVVVSGLLCSNAVLLLPPVFAGFAVYLLWSFCSTIVCYFCFRRLGHLPARGRVGAWQMNVVVFAAWLLLVGFWGLNIAEGFGLGKTVDVAWSRVSEEYTAAPELCQSYPVLTAADLGLEYSQDSRYLDGRTALLVSRFDYSEIAPDAAGESHILTTERYQCASAALARWMLSARRLETARGADFLWGELDWQAVPGLGFDESWSACQGSYLLLRQGKVVVLVGATGFDLMQTEYLDVLRERLLSQESGLFYPLRGDGG